VCRARGIGAEGDAIHHSAACVSGVRAREAHEPGDPRHLGAHATSVPNGVMRS
jgi:hypothetical protein